LDALEIAADWLPKVYEGPERTGGLRESLADELGLPAGIPVAAGGGDNAAAAVGTGIIREGLLSSSIGTSGVLFAHLDEFTVDPSGRLHAFCHAVPGAYHLMGVTLSAGGSLAWLRDTLGGSYAELVDAASEVPPGSEGLLFLPYLTGERTPHLDPSARGAFFGLTARHSVPHLTRAVMEGVAFSLRDSFEIMHEAGLTVEEVRATGGGARSSLWRQLQADVYGTLIRRTTSEEGPAFGAALLAGVASGVYSGVEEACSNIELHEEITEPDSERVRVYKEHYEVYRSLYPATGAAMHRLSELASAMKERR
jgi:xylulokinase